MRVRVEIEEAEREKRVWLKRKVREEPLSQMRCLRRKGSESSSSSGSVKEAFRRKVLRPVKVSGLQSDS